MTVRPRLGLVFEDGPDHLSTPRFLRVLERFDVRATFFVLGVQVARDRGLAREMAAAGHELAVHGWDHRPLLLRGPAGVHADLARTRDLLAETTGQPVRWLRPAGGVATLTAMRSCRRLGLLPVTDRTTPSAPGRPPLRLLPLRDADHDRAGLGSWRPSLHMLTAVLEACAARGVDVGPLGDGLPLP